MADAPVRWLRLRYWLRTHAAAWILVLLVVLAWDLLTRADIVDPRDVSTPGAVAALAWQWMLNGFIWWHVGITLYEVAVGYVIGTVLGLGVAFLFFFRPRVALICDPLIVTLNAAPRAVLAPFAVLLFGVDTLSKVMLVILVVAMITLLNLHAGLREVDGTIVDNARVMGADRRQLTEHVYLPAALVWIVAAMRMSIGQAFTAAIVCELLGGSNGLGWIISAGQNSVKPDWIMAGLLFASVIVVVLDFVLLAPLERRGSHWRVF